MILFLDFDGVLHPLYPTAELPEFCYLPRLAAVLRDFPRVEIVISSSWRTEFELEALRAFFPADLQARIIGVTPWLPGSRCEEVLAWLREHRPGSPWLALDDQPKLWRQTGRLLLCGDGFREQEEARLRSELRRSLGYFSQN